MEGIKIDVDNGHGSDTAGKRSPDYSLREYAYTREIAARVVFGLKELGYDAELLVPELHDVPLAERVRRVNAHCKERGKDNVLLVSIHNNAAGMGQWMNARGWCVFTCAGQTKSDILAEHLYAAAERNFIGHKIRTDKTDGDKDIEKAFYICRKTYCPAVLVENFFMDNKQDLEYLLSDEGKDAIVRTHIEGIVSYIKAQYGNN